MGHYLIQIITCQLLFLAVYDFMLKKETFFNWNRFYLLAVSIFSMILPLIKIESFKRIIPQDYVVVLPEIVLGSVNEPSRVASGESSQLVEQAKNFQWSWELIYYIGVSVALIVFILKCYKMVRLVYKQPFSKSGSLRIVKLTNSRTAFSFFNTLFLGDGLDEQETTSIIEHEMVHINQKHTWDLLLFEMLRIVFWFNPLIYLFQNRISVLHEYIADAQVSKKYDRTQYYQSLLSQVFETHKISFVNSFFNQSLIKKRIVMLQKSKSRKAHLIKYLLLIPIVLGMLIYSSCSDDKTQSEDTQKQVSITKSIALIKDKIQEKGSLNVSEEDGLKLLSKVLKSKKLDQNLISEVGAYIGKENKTEVEGHVADILIEIQAKGGLTETEISELKKLLIFIDPKGFEDSYYVGIAQDVEVPFEVIEKIPMFPGCDSNLANEEQKNCFRDKITSFVMENFNMTIADNLGLKGAQKVSVFFKIDANGQVVDAKAEAAHSKLEEEALRVLNTLPQFIPGEQKGKKVVVPYFLPIKFIIE